MKRSKSSLAGIFLNRITPFALLTIAFGILVGNWWPASATGSDNVLLNLSAGVTGRHTENDENRAVTPVPNHSTSIFSIFANRPSILPLLLPDPPPVRAVVRRGFNLNGRIEGSVQQLLGESTVLNSNAVLTGDLMVLGSPNLVRNGSTTFGGTVVGTGSVQPSNYSVTMNSGSQLGRLLTRTDAVAMPTVSAPPAPAGNRNVTINSSGQSPGDFATLRNLTLNSNVGNFSVPPGTYGSFTANSGSGFVLGIAGATQASAYNFSTLTLNSGSQFQVVGPIVITLGTGLTLNSSTGSSSNPNWLQIKVASGGVTLNSGSNLYGSVVAPSGTVTINTRLVGNVTADRLTVNSGGVLQITQADGAPPVLTVLEPNQGAVVNTGYVTVSGTVTDESSVTIFANGTPLAVDGNNFIGYVPIVEGANTLTVTATDAAGNRSEVTRNVTRDTTGPTISVTQPSDFSYTTASQIQINGSFSDAASITVNGTAATISGSTYSSTVTLSEGLNTVLVRALDSAGNISEIFHTVTRDTTAPSISVTDPTQNQSVKALVVSGTVNDLSPVEVQIDGAAVTVVDGTFRREQEVGEGERQVRVRATDTAGNQVEVLRTVVVDLSVPIFSDVIPANGSAVNPTTTISGRITDISAVTVRVNGLTASAASNGTFSIENVPVSEGENQLKLIATDAAGNENDFDLLLIGQDRTSPSSPILFPVNSPTRLTTATLEGRAEPGALISVSGGAELSTTNAAYGSGIFAVNVRLNAGTNELSVTATDSGGNASSTVQVAITSNPSLELPPVGAPAQINVSTGNAQKGLINAELPRPLIAVVTDKTGASIAAVTVRFTIQAGGGRFVGGGSDFIDVITDAQGYARATYVSGTLPGAQQIQADFAGNTLSSVAFLAEALMPTGSETTVTGAVLDQNLRALPNVLVRIGGQQTRTGSNGRFVVRNVTSGPHQLLELIGRDQINLPGRWPNITYDLDVLPGVENSLRRPLFLPRVNEGVPMPLDQNGIVTQDTTHESAVVGGEPPIKITAKAGTRIIFPPDVTDRRLSVTRIANNRIPMALEDGRATNLYISVQPSGAVFETPLEVSFPNLDRLPANSEVALMSFDHDAGRYVRVGSGHVSADGRRVTSDPGSGIRVGAWHALPPPEPSPEVTVLGHIQVQGNPQFEDKEIVSEEAWVEGERAVLLTGMTGAGNSLGNPIVTTAPRLDYRATLTVPRNSPPRSSRMESLVLAEKKLKIKFDSFDKKFAPSVERFNFKYSVTPGEGTAPQVAKFEVFKNADLNNPIYSDTISPVADKLDYSQGGISGWDGKINQGADSGKYIEPKNGPFTIRISVAVQTDFSGAVKAENTIKVEIHEMSFAPKDDFKSFKPNATATEVDGPIELTVKVRNKAGNGVVTAIPFKIKWSFDDPDDTASNNIIDPNGDGDSNGNDNTEVRFGGKRADSTGANPARIMWKTVSGFTATISTDGQSAEAEVSTSPGADQGKSKMTFSASVIGGDNYFLFAKYLKDDGTVFQEKKSDKWSVWKNLDFQNAYRLNGGVDIGSVMSRANINPAFNGNGYTDYTLGRVVNLANGAQSPEFVSLTILPPSAADTPNASDTPAQITTKAERWFAQNRANIDAEFLAYIQANNIPLNSVIGGRYYHPKYDSRTGTGGTNYWPPGIRINTSDPGAAPVMNDPDGEWGSVPGSAISHRAFIFLNAANLAQFIIIGRHEIGHASDHVRFDRDDGNNGSDHASSGLMHPNGDPSMTNPFGDPNFSPKSILRLRGVIR